MALNIDIKDPKTQKMIALAMIPVVVLYGFFNFMIKPRLATIEVKKKEVQTLNQALQTTKKSLTSPIELKVQKENLEAKYGELEQFLPNEENVSQLIDQLSEIEYQAKVYLVGFNATQTIEGNGKPYKANLYRVNIEAGYHQFADFMGRIMSLPRIISFSELRMALNSNLSQDAEQEVGGPEDQPRHLSIDCILTTYVFTMGEGTESSEK
ncbi:type 4a pilus biogenesis protein PilO [Candidatus Latescibacterota bacterium]